MLITTTPGIEGRTVTEYLGVVTAQGVLGVNVFKDVGADAAFRHLATFFPGDQPVRIRDLYDLVGGVPGSEVLIDGKPVPFARELWLPLIWFLIR